jgi:hypothetical protein
VVCLTSIDLSTKLSRESVDLRKGPFFSTLIEFGRPKGIAMTIEIRKPELERLMQEEIVRGRF